MNQQALALIDSKQSELDAKLQRGLSRLSDEDIQFAYDELLEQGPDRAVRLLFEFVQCKPLDTAAMLGSVYARELLRRKEVSAMSV